MIAEALRRQRALTVFALLCGAALLPALLAWGGDDRSLRGVSVWLKPMKFMASIGLFALCTAWFTGLLPPAQRQRRGVRVMAWTVIIAGSLELAYITLQAARGEGSHYNFVDTLHVVLYQLMGAGAMAMTATQAWLAWQIGRHGDPALNPAWRDAVVLGLALTFALGAGAGAVLASFQPPAGAGLPGVGWHLGGGDLRPAHFIGMHAQQFLPLAGLALVALGAGGWRASTRRGVLGVLALGYAALWLVALVLGLQGAVLTVPGAPALTLPRP